MDLEKIPIKYPGLAPWEVWVSESQERMTYAVSPDKLDAFMALAKKHDAEATVIGKFTDSGRCVVRLNGKTIVDMDLDFLHDGLPQLHLHSEYREPKNEEPAIRNISGDELVRVMADMAGRLNLCSHEYVTRQYDHEVQGGAVIKPLIGKKQDVHSDAGVVRPVLSSWQGVALSTGILPSYGDIDPYAMAECGIDTAFRNVVAAGANPDRIALLDNFCWCSSNEPERLGQLKRAASACYNTAKKYRAPFISGKDSMFNDFKGYDSKGWEVKISVPPTILISSLGIVPDVRKCQTLDFKAEGDLVYFIGITAPEMGGSEYFAYLGERERGERYIGNSVPRVDLSMSRARYHRIFQALESEVFSSIHAVGAGGLGMGLAKMAMAGELGAEIDLDMVPCNGELSTEELLFSESQSRFIVTIPTDRCKRFEDIFGYEDFAIVGKVTKEPVLVFRKGREAAGRVQVSDLKQNYKKTLGW